MDEINLWDSEKDKQRKENIYENIYEIDESWISEILILLWLKIMKNINIMIMI